MEIPTMFPPVPELNLTFCVDTSGSMYHGLPVVKQHLMETLNKMAASDRESMFNVIEFNSHVTQWADKMVRCTPETVKVVSKWVDNLSASSGTNMLHALLTALDDSSCDAVYLITDSLPDQHPTTLLDNVMLVSQARPVHCVYLSVGDEPDPRVDEFLENLSFETHATYHIVSLTKHGCLERVAPVVSSQSLGQRIMRTDTGYPIANQKSCSITTSLQVNPDLCLSRNLSHQGPYAPWGYPQPWYPPFGQLPNPYGWARYRPAHGWLTAQKEMFDAFRNVSLAAGALLVDKSVLVRRHSDGWFYQGIVRSQIASNKFLVALGPCTRGKYRDTVFQETLDYDIISHTDARNHTIITGDNVLAPWQPVGEKFGAGIVIDGHELRNSDGSDEKQGITVKFSQGATQDIPLNHAIWIPRNLYDRLVFEHQMPISPKTDLIRNSDNYPMETLAGYPTSGPKAVPTEYLLPPEIDFNYEPIVYPNSGFYPYWPNYNDFARPVMYKPGGKGKVHAAVDSDEVNALIPGTELTAQELNEKVASQLLESEKWIEDRDKDQGNVDRVGQYNGCSNRCGGDSKRDHKYDVNQNYCSSREIEENPRILHKRETIHENNLKKSVTWKSEDLTNGDEGYDRIEDCSHDSGIGSSPDMGCYSHRYDDDCCYGNDYQRLNKPCKYSKKSSEKVPWRYWRSDTKPEVIGPPKHDAFIESAPTLPLELRHKDRDSSHFRNVTQEREPRYHNSDMLQTPHPPAERPALKQGPGVELGSAVGEKEREIDARNEKRRDTRRLRFAERAETITNERIDEQNRQKMNDVNRFIRQDEREIKESQQREQRQLAINHTLEAKQKMARELRGRQEQTGTADMNRDRVRIEARRANQESREEDARLRAVHWENGLLREREVKLARQLERCEAYNGRLAEKENKDSVQEQRCQSAKLVRLQRFQNREDQLSYKKELKAQMNKHTTDTYMSQVFAS